jgi:hypothetical protein
MIQHLMGGRQSVTTPCTVDILRNGEFMHAHVELDGIEVGPGDSVIVHDAPDHVEFGEHIVVRRMATITRATSLDRVLTKISAYLELTELYEVSFSAGRAPT